MNFYVYEHRHPGTHRPFYVGKGRGKRAWTLYPYARNGRHGNAVREIAALGLNVEVRIVAAALSEEQAHALEIERIDRWRTAGVELCNVTSGGEHRGLQRKPFTAEHCANLSKAKSAKPSVIIFTPELRKKLGDSHRGKKMPPRSAEYCDQRSQIARNPSPETRARMSAAKIGKPLSAEHRANIGASLTGHPCSESTRAKLRLARARKALCQPITETEEQTAP